MPSPQIDFVSLLAANPGIADPNLVFVGDKINIPCPPKIECAGVFTNFTWPSNSLNSYNVTMQQVLDANPHLLVPDIWHRGDVVYIPPCTQTPDSVAISAVETARASCVQQTYVAQQGDIPGTVAAMFNMQIGDLYRLNPKLRVFATRLITAGQSLAVLSCPKAARLSWTSAQVCKSFYTIADGDTLKTVAAKAGTTMAKLMIGNPFITYVTQVLPAKRKLCIVP